MFRRRITITLLCCSTIVTAAILVANGTSESPLNIRIVNVTETENTKMVTMELQRPNPKIRLRNEDLKFQVQIARQWQPLQRFPELENLLTSTNCEQVVFATEACRLVIGYRTGGSPRCKAYFLLYKHGISKNFPRLASKLLRCVPQERPLHRFQIDLMIPAEARTPTQRG